MYKKPVIVFEGIEGSGKTFHSKYVCRYLKKKKYPLLIYESLEETQILKKFEI